MGRFDWTGFSLDRVQDPSEFTIYPKIIEEGYCYPSWDVLSEQYKGILPGRLTVFIYILVKPMTNDTQSSCRIILAVFGRHLRLCRGAVKNHCIERRCMEISIFSMPLKLRRKSLTHIQQPTRWFLFASQAVGEVNFVYNQLVWSMIVLGSTPPSEFGDFLQPEFFRVICRPLKYRRGVGRWRCIFILLFTYIYIYRVV